MKVTNVVLSILVLLLALASAVFSYLLFGKRAQMVGGWDQMAAAISTTAAAIDKESGTKAAETLSKEALAHTHYAQLSANLEKYNTLINDLLAQRNKLADALQAVAGMTEGGVSAEELQKLASYKDASDKVVNGVRNNRNYHQKVMETLARDLAPLDISCDPNDLMKSQSGALEQLSQKLQRHQRMLEEYQAALQEISNMSFRNSYQTELLNSAIGRAKKANQSINDLRGQLTRIADERRDLLETKRQLTQEVETLKNKLTKQQTQIDSLRKVLGLDPNAALPMPWQDGSVEARLALTGKVVEVNCRYGYIGINIGTETRVIQQLSKTKTGKIDPQVREGMKLKVFRGRLDNGTPDYVAEITLNKVGATCSIADIPAGAKIKVGDQICFEQTPAKK